jgi:Dynamin family.
MDRKQKRAERRQQRQAAAKAAALNAKSSEDEDSNNPSNNTAGATAQQTASDAKFAKLLSLKEDVLLNFVANINKLYQEKLGRPAPFMTFVICGMQSAGKSTIMERFMQAPLNIIQEGTGTRCPLDTTCIHDSSLDEPRCELSGEELDPAMSGTALTTDEVFRAITAHNIMLANKDEFSTHSLRLVYRAKNVQNMRFVDTPGIISNKGTGQDNREDIKRILRETMKKPNSKLCVLVEPKEFSTNPIIDFCDETFGGRPKWTKNSIVLMTKFDKQLEDARSGSKANKFFKEFHDNDLYPYLIITPTLAKEDLPADKLLIERRKLLHSAHGNEMERFEDWRLGHEKFRETCPDDELLHPDIENKIGFSVAKDKMREIMLTDTAQRLPEVLSSLRGELSDSLNELEQLRCKKKLMDPREVKIIVGEVLHEVGKRINSYLDGDLETASKFPDVLRDLEEELEEEEESEWCLRRLGTSATLEEEEEWRTLIDTLLDERKIPKYINPEKKFLGGKQFQRAVHLMKVVMAGEYKSSPGILLNILTQS